MSWTKKANEYDDIVTVAKRAPPAVLRWVLQIWEVTKDHPQGRWHPNPAANCLQQTGKLRIVFAPLDLVQMYTHPEMLELLQAADIPSCFATERIRSVSHSFGHLTTSQRSNNNDVRVRTCSWFHFLCKNINLVNDENGQPTAVVDSIAPSAGFPMSSLPQADFSYLRSGFFLSTTIKPDGDDDEEPEILLVCFGATRAVRTRLEQFIACRDARDDATLEPSALLDLILEGLYLEVDETAWKMNRVFGVLEHLILEHAHAKDQRHMGSKIPFVALHNCAKHIVYVDEAVESLAHLVDGVLEQVNRKGPVRKEQSLSASSSTRTPQPAETPHLLLIKQQLADRLHYQRSLLRSTQLRLSSLNRRTASTLTLAFNLVTQQDSAVMRQDSSAMKMIAGITMIFLPTTGVAAVVGSQLFIVEKSSGSATDPSRGGGEHISWSVTATPLFKMLWWIAIPLTFLVVVLGALWTWRAGVQEQGRRLRRGWKDLVALGKGG